MKSVHILSFQRFKFADKELLNQFLSMADILIADTKFSQRELEKECQSKHRNLTLHELAPFDADLKLGESQSMRQQVIYWYVDNSLADILPTAIQKLTHRLITHKENSIVIASKSSLQIRSITSLIASTSASDSTSTSLSGSTSASDSNSASLIKNTNLINQQINNNAKLPRTNARQSNYVEGLTAVVTILAILVSKKAKKTNKLK